MAPSTDETADQVAKARLALEAAEAEHASALTHADDNRSTEDLTLDLLEAIVMRQGNRPDQAALLKRIKAKLAPGPAPNASPAEAKVA